MASFHFRLREREPVRNHPVDQTVRLSVLTTISEGEAVLFEEVLMVIMNVNGQFITKESQAIIDSIVQPELRRSI